MANIVKGPGGLWRSAEGLAAVFMLRSVRPSDGVRRFSFKPTMMGEAITIEWPDHPANLALLPDNVANALIGKGHARHATDREARVWNGDEPAPVSGDDQRGGEGGEAPSAGGEGATGNENPPAPNAELAPADGAAAGADGAPAGQATEVKVAFVPSPAKGTPPANGPAPAAKPKGGRTGRRKAAGAPKA